MRKLTPDDRALLLCVATDEQRRAVELAIQVVLEGMEQNLIRCKLDDIYEKRQELDGGRTLAIKVLGLLDECKNHRKSQ